MTARRVCKRKRNRKFQAKRSVIYNVSNDVSCKQTNPNWYMSRQPVTFVVELKFTRFSQITSCWFILTHLQVLKYCPKDLQADICVHLNRVILENNVAFRDANTGVKRAIARNFWISHVAPGDRIIHHGESLDVLYFIARGSLEVKQGESVVGLLGEKKVLKSRHFLILLHSSEIVFVMYAILNSHCVIEKTSFRNTF